VSKQRARLRAEREAALAQKRAAELARRERGNARRQRQAGRELRWRHVRLWRHGHGFANHKDKWAALVTLILAVIVLTYLFTGSLTAVVLLVLVAIVGLPALAVLIFDKRS
jgi:hypothetical protein